MSTLDARKAARQALQDLLADPPSETAPPQDVARFMAQAFAHLVSTTSPFERALCALGSYG